MGSVDFCAKCGSQLVGICFSTNPPFYGYKCPKCGDHFRDVTKMIGKWKYQTLTVPGGKGQTYAKWSCSCCKHKFKERSNYCPNCGADMREEQDGR